MEEQKEKEIKISHKIYGKNKKENKWGEHLLDAEWNIIYVFKVTTQSNTHSHTLIQIFLLEYNFLLLLLLLLL